MEIRKRIKTREKSEKERSILEGSLVVEAAVVVSISFLVIGALLLSVLFLHDRAVMQCLVCETASVGSNFVPGKDGTEKAEKVRKEMNAERLMGSRNISTEKGIGEKTSSASGLAQYPVPGMFMQYFKKGNLDICCSWTCKMQDPVNFIRKIRGVESIERRLQEGSSE